MFAIRALAVCAIPIGAAVALGWMGSAVTAQRVARAPVAPSAAPAARAPSKPPATVSGPSPERWAAIGRAARAFVAAETPDTALPFVPGTSGRGGTMIVAHYFPPFPLSIGNGSAKDDYYARNYLQASGEGGKFAEQGGFLRDRPLPVPVHAVDPTPANLAIDVARAARIGIDAFGVDILGTEGRTWAAARLLPDAAAATAPGFRIIPEPDMVALDRRDLTVAELADILEPFVRHRAAWRLEDGRALVMPFRAEARDPAFWSGVIAEMARRRAPIALAPVYLGLRKTAEMAPISWAASVWGDRDVDAGDRAVRLAGMARAAGTPRWIAPVAPQDYRPKSRNFWEARNSEAYRAQWTSAIGNGGKRVHLITWNDYSESTQISPSGVTQFVFYDLAGYYGAWAKRGSPPPIVRDVLMPVHRRQILRAEDDGGGRPPLARRGSTPLANDVELLAFLTAPGRVALQSGDSRIERDLPAGLHALRVPAAAGRPGYSLTRRGRTIVSGHSPWTIEARPSRQDATYGGASSARRIVDAPGIDRDPAP